MPFFAAAHHWDLDTVTTGVNFDMTSDPHPAA
jgi:hypothetical protein